MAICHFSQLGLGRPNSKLGLGLGRLGEDYSAERSETFIKKKNFENPLISDKDKNIERFTCLRFARHPRPS